MLSLYSQVFQSYFSISIVFLCSQISSCTFFMWYFLFSQMAHCTVGQNCCINIRVLRNFTILDALIRLYSCYIKIFKLNKRIIKTCNKQLWLNWVMSVSESLISGYWKGLFVNSWLVEGAAEQVIIRCLEYLFSACHAEWRVVY